MKILLAVDGSKTATEAARATVKLAQALASPPTLVLLHADEPLLRRAAAELGLEATRAYHEGNSALAMKGARAVLRRAGLAWTEKMAVGEASATIVKAAASGKFDLVVMGSRGRTALNALFLGSVATKVMAQTTVPVMVVR